ncbi:uncharacterized protein LOC132715735 isoform X1 [Ruditapes philippinarum]|uniref:uncharacterized protein LOC132715735 isoform X1 n=1 Tax=Ruditapes philippinarum TaxID=129788 RepID=UPI00295B570A|nr:uncharacterized protein LOC132715735 isoform X1 [Ruditapes philippinarum]
MTKIAIILLVSSAIICTSAQDKKTGQHMQHFGTGVSLKSVKERLQVQPLPVPGFDVNMWLGQWFHQFQKAPCSWAIAEDFTDYIQLMLRKGNILIGHESIRNRNVCNTMTSLNTVTGTGRFYGKDLIGDNWSGKVNIVATDYIGYSIDWGCTKWSTLDQTCADPWLYVKTRQMKLSKDVLERIESALQNIFGISINELKRIPNERPCPIGTKNG